MQEAYLLVIDSFPWASITLTLIGDSEELIRECNSGYGLKCFSEEGTESYNNLVRRNCEILSRKSSFEGNTTDILVRLTSQSDPVLVGYRRKLFL